MNRRLTPFEKELLIKIYRDNPDQSMNSFCKANGITIQTFQKWMRQYECAGIEGLAKGSKFTDILPPGTDPSIDSYKREILRLRIENERLKKNYIVRKTENGKTQIQRLEPMNSISSEPSQTDIP